MSLRGLALLTCALLVPLASRADTPTYTFSGAAPTDDNEFFTLPFEVPAGTVEIEVDHGGCLTSGDILDWGLNDETGQFRGWGGGNTEPAFVGTDRASRSYLTGAINPGMWEVLVGKAQIVTAPANYSVNVYVRSTVTQPPQPTRRPYAPVAPIISKPGWYRGDLHVHDSESGDSMATIDQVAALAMQRGLSWVELSDHNTISQLDYIDSYQATYPTLLFVPGVEWTTYHGHANGIGATKFVDHTVGWNNVTAQGAQEAYAAQGAVFSPNHPLLNIPSLCIGCGWSYTLPATVTPSFEIASGGWDAAGQLYDIAVIATWDQMLDTGAHVAAVGGSDDHRAGMNLPEFGSEIGSPTTVVYAQNLSAAAIVQGIKEGRTQVMLDGPTDPMVSITSDDGLMIGDTVHGPTHLHVTVSGGNGDQLQLFKNGVAQDPVNITSDPFTSVVAVSAPSTGTDRWRAEIITQQRPATVTSHIWVGPVAAKRGCGSTEPAALGLVMVLLLAIRSWLRRGTGAEAI